MFGILPQPVSPSPFRVPRWLPFSDPPRTYTSLPRCFWPAPPVFTRLLLRFQTANSSFASCRYRANSALFFHAQVPALVLGEAIILHQRDMGRTDDRAAAALDTVEQVILWSSPDLGACVPVHLLRQQADQAYFWRTPQRMQNSAAVPGQRLGTRARGERQLPALTPGPRRRAGANPIISPP